MSIFQGDPKLSVTGDGLALTFTGGQPAMDKGLINAVIQTLFYRPWFLNVAMADPINHIGSNFLEALSKPITKANILTARSIGISAMQQWIDEGMASEVDIRIRNSSGSSLQVLVMIKIPSGSPIVILATKYGLNWLFHIDSN